MTNKIIKLTREELYKKTNIGYISTFDEAQDYVQTQSKLKINLNYYVINPARGEDLIFRFIMVKDTKNKNDFFAIEFEDINSYKKVYEILNNHSE